VDFHPRRHYNKRRQSKKQHRQNIESKQQRATENLRADKGILVRVESCPFFSRNNFFGRRCAGLGGARIVNFVPFSLVPWRNSGGEGVCRCGSLGFNFFFRGSRGFVRNRDFALRMRRNLGVLGNDCALFDFSTFGKGGKRRCSFVVLDKIGKYRQEIESIAAVEEIAVKNKKRE
jgi:hypothetical protein